MIKEIQYAGYATEPSDYECQDGQLALSINLINEDNQLKPVFQPATVMQIPQGYTLLATHNTTAYSHYILTSDDNNLCYCDAQASDGNFNTIHSLGTSNVIDVKPMGNLLILLGDDGQQHFLIWKQALDNYKYLGTELPRLNLSFGLQATAVESEEFTVKLTDKINPGSQNSNYISLDTEANRKDATEQILAKVNKFVTNESNKKRRFIFPFLVRYAYRLFDGSVTRQSPPVLMITTSGPAPSVLIQNKNELFDNNDHDKIKARVAALTHQLDFIPTSEEELTQLDNWKDIITSVVFYVSAPIYTYNQAGEIDHFIELNKREQQFTVAKLLSTIGTAPSNSYYGFWWIAPLITQNYNADQNEIGKHKFILPQKDYLNDIKDCSAFYLLKEINTDNIVQSTGRQVIEMPENFLESILARETMPDDNPAHDLIMPSLQHTYNGRMNMAVNKKKLFNGFKPATQFIHSDNLLFDLDNSDNFDTRGTSSYNLFVFVRKDGAEYIIDAGTSTLANGKIETQAGTDYILQLPAMTYIYYPDPDAYMAVIVNNTDHMTFKIDMARHSFLSGSVGFIGFDLLQDRLKSMLPNDIMEQCGSPTSDQGRIIDLPYKLYTSEVNNPFHYPNANVNTIGTGNILALASATKALSQGQFGQFPLYVFTTEGVWAMEVSQTGTFSARQPVTRDVCRNAESITQLDAEVLFATDRGIMLISGSQTHCITDGIFSEAPFNILELPGIDQLHAKLGHTADACLPIKPFLRFLEGCQMVYDYVHQHIFVYNPTKENGTPLYTYAYVFSLKSKMWGMVFSDLASTINAYPEALAITHDNKLVSLSQTDNEVCKALYITRPIKLEAPDTHKTVSALIQRGHFQRGDVATVLYGSRNLYDWFPIWSSKDHYLRGFSGTPYKYFRIAGLATLTEGKSIFGASVNFEPRHTNQLR